MKRISRLFLTSLTGSLLLTVPVLTMAGDVNTTQSAISASESSYQVVSEQINPVILSKTEFEDLHKDQQRTVATRWGLTSQEYATYLSEMHNTPSGLWYKDLDPAEVLLMNAKNDQERDHYADIVVKLAHDRGERELAAERAYHAAWRRLYPNLPRVQLPGASL